MKKFTTLAITAALSAVLAAPSFAGKPDAGDKGNGSPKGKFEKFLLIGHPHNESDVLKKDDSNGRAILIPLKTTNKNSVVVCPAGDGSSQIIGDVAGENLYSSEVDNGVRLDFTKSDVTKLEIADRDATDGNAEVLVPADWADATRIDLYVRVLGKPGGCFRADGYVNDGSYYFYSGSVLLKRKKGNTGFIDAGELTDVYYCPDGTSVVPTGGHNYDCLVNGTTDQYESAIEMNVFADVFDEYFWDITNDGSRVVQVLMRAVFD